MRVIIMGAPGAGKGTQARFVADHLDVPAVSTGDIFRANVAGGTPLGIEARRYMDAGAYVPDEITNEMVRNRLIEPDVARGFLLDGYPRTVAQVAELDSMAAATGHAIDHVLCLTVDTEELVGRLARRARLEGRTDDTPDVIRHRQELYGRETAPLLGLYRDRGLLRPVDGTGEVEDVTRRLLAALTENATAVG